MQSEVDADKAKVIKTGAMKSGGLAIVIIAAFTLGFAVDTLLVEKHFDPKKSCVEVLSDYASPQVSNAWIEKCLEEKKVTAEIERLTVESELIKQPGFWGALATITATLFGAFMLYVNGFFDAKLASLRIERDKVENLRTEVMKEEEHLRSLKFQRDELATKLARQKFRYAQDKVKSLLSKAGHDMELLWRLCSRPGGIISKCLSACTHNAPEDQQLELLSKLNGIFVPILLDHELTSSIMLVDSSGMEYILLNERDFLESQEKEYRPYVWRNRIIRTDHWGQKALERYWEDPLALKPKGSQWIENLTERLGKVYTQNQYEPRLRMYTRPWLGTDGLAERKRLWNKLENTKKAMHWTSPYFFYTTKVPGITISKGWIDPGNDDQRYVLAMDITAAEISQATTRLQVGENGKVIVFTEDGRIIGLPAHQRFSHGNFDEIQLFYKSVTHSNGDVVSDQDALLPTAAEVGAELDMPDIGIAYEKWSEDFNTDPSKTDINVSFRYRGSGWEGRFAACRYPQSEGAIWVGMIAPSYEIAREGMADTPL